MRADWIVRFVRLIPIVLVVLGVLSSGTVRAESRPGITGKLETVRGVRLLRLWGTMLWSSPRRRRTVFTIWQRFYLDSLSKNLLKREPREWF